MSCVFHSNKRLTQEIGMRNRNIDVTIYCIHKQWDSEALGVSLWEEFEKIWKCRLEKA